MRQRPITGQKTRAQTFKDHDGSKRHRQPNENLKLNRLRAHQREHKIPNIVPTGMTHCRPPPNAQPN